MKVGVVLSDSMPDDGGGYSFQADIFDAFGELASTSGHEFVVFYDAENIDHYKSKLCFEKLNFVSFKSPLKTQLPSFSQRLMGYLRRLVATALGPVIGYLKRLAATALSPVMGYLKQLAATALGPVYSSSAITIHEPQNSLEMNMISHGIEMAWFVSGGGWGTIDIPYIATVWDLMHLSDPWFPELSARGEWENRDRILEAFLKRATAIITGTHVGKSEIGYFYNIPSERIYLLPHPTPRFALEPTGTDDTVLSRHGISGKYLLYPAQFWPHKNHTTLLQALKILESSDANDYSLVFVGSDKGNLDYVKQRAVEFNLMNKIFFLGFIPVEELTALYRNAFALTYVSFCGPENLPPLEAFALGCPVLASDIPGAREQLGDSAYLVDPTKPEEMAKAILTLGTDSEQRELLIKRGFQRASSWTSTDYVEGVFSILDGFAPIRACWPSPQ